MSLRVNQLVGFGVGGGSPSLALSYRATYSYSAGSHTSRSFTNCDIGVASPTRYVLVAVNTGDNGTIESCTVNGAATTILASQAGQSIFITNAPVTSGATATIAITNSDAMSVSTIGVFSIDGNVDFTPVDTSVISRSGGTIIGAQNIDVAAGGVVIAITSTGTDSATCSWSGLTENYDQFITYSSYSTASASIEAAGVLTFTPTWTGSDYADLVAVSLKAIG